MLECKKCEGSGRIPFGEFGSYYRDGERYDPPGYEVCDACGGEGAAEDDDGEQVIPTAPEQVGFTGKDYRWVLLEP